MDQRTAVIYQFRVTGKDASARAIDTAATEETDAHPVAAGWIEKSVSGGRAYLIAGRQNFTEEDFKNPAVAPKIARFLIAEIERLDDDCGSLKQTVVKYTELRVEVAALQEASKKTGLLDLLSVICLAAGSAGLGAGPSYLAIPNLAGVGWTFIVLSAALVLAGLIPPIVAFIARVRK